MADGASNDVVNVYIDGDLKHTGTSWENYFRFDTEASAEQSPRIVKTAIFRTGGSSAPDTAGKGFLFDNVSLTSGETPTEPTPTPNPLIPAECAGMDLNGEVIIGTGKSETLNGTNKNDLIIAKGGSDKINGKNGDDCIVAGGGGDTVHGNNGNDIILGNAGADSLYGDNGEDTIYGQGGADNMDGGNGKDTLIGGGASDYARGGNGKDMCIAEAKVSCEL
jgi:Ca2+-binding RTX toxin-like protein